MKVATRTVVVLGRRPQPSLDGLQTRLREDDELVVLSLGYPVTPAQREMLLAMQDLAAEVGAWFDGVLVLSVDEMLPSLRSDDEVQVVARGREARRLRTALAQIRV